MISFLSRTKDTFFFFLSLWIYLWLAETSQQPISQISVRAACCKCRRMNITAKDLERTGQASDICRVSQNHIYTVYIRNFWQEHHQIYGHIRRIYTILANPRYLWVMSQLRSIIYINANTTFTPMPIPIIYMNAITTLHYCQKCSLWVTRLCRCTLFEVHCKLSTRVVIKRLEHVHMCTMSCKHV